MNKKSPEQHIQFLDGLRGIAILLVVIFHFWQISWLDHTIQTPFFALDLNFIARSGFVGVELFFFLSGFCLFLPHARFLFDGRPLSSLNSFAYKRFIKIFPSYVLSIFLIVWINDIEFINWSHFFKVFFSHVVFSTNYLTEFNVINGVFWSLAVEVQFYLFFPLIAYFFRRFPWIVFFLMCVVALAFRLYYLINDASALGRVMSYMPASLDLFACGMMGAYITTKWKSILTGVPKIPVFLTILSIASMAVFVELLKWYVDTLSYGGKASYWLVFNRLTMGFVFVFITVSGVFSSKIWIYFVANKFFVFLGLISYNLYIWHQMVALYLYRNEMIPSATEAQRDDFVWQLVFTGVVFVVSLSIASLITYGFERPLMKYGLIKWVELSSLRCWFKKKILS